MSNTQAFLGANPIVHITFAFSRPMIPSQSKKKKNRKGIQLLEFLFMWFNLPVLIVLDTEIVG